MKKTCKKLKKPAKTPKNLQKNQKTCKKSKKPTENPKNLQKTHQGIRREGIQLRHHLAG